MKFKVRYADQIVGILTVVALLSLIVVIFFLGKTQRWFSANYDYKTYATTASGLSRNMDVLFKGVSIGKVKSFDLTDDNRIEVIFSIQEEYWSRIKEGSLVEVIDSPIGLGAKFVFYSGLGEELPEGELIPLVGSPEGKALIDRGLAVVPAKDDFIAALIDSVNGIMDNINGLLANVDSAVEELHTTLDGLNVAPNGQAVTALGQVVTNVQALTSNVQVLTSNLASDMANPDGVRKILNGSGDSINALESAFVSLSGALDHIERALVYLPREMPQIFSLLSEARTAVAAAEDVLISLRNNPLLRGGVPEHAEIDASGTNPRNISF